MFETGEFRQVPAISFAFGTARAVGDRTQIMIVFHALWNLPTAEKIAKMLESCQPKRFEDPIRMNPAQARDLCWTGSLGDTSFSRPCPMEGPDLRVELQPAVLERPDPATHLPDH